MTRNKTESRKSKEAFTLIELAVVVSIIFILVGSMIVMVPRIELRAAIRRAQGDILLLESALALYEENERALPPDKLDTNNVWQGSAPDSEQISNIMLVHYLTTNRSKSGYLELKADNVERYADANMDYNQADSMLVQKFSSVTRNPNETGIPVYQMLDPWGNPYVYDNNRGDNITDFGLGGNLTGRPNHNPDFDLFSRGPNSVTAVDNGVDDDDDLATDEMDGTDSDERLFNGRERKGGGELGDDINNYKTAK
ncbi:MAG: hypothetical protein O3B01_27660, partial [Planctomycetota bacterium]|nr:hypothetical protein [Planctomycetota bacterium]